jgi:hypothetical protein
MAALGRSVTVHVASLNTRRFTELCLRSMWRSAGAPFELVVGDVSSVDGSGEMLRRMTRSGRLRLQQAPYPHSHGEWIDQWRAECESDVFVVVDSDIEFAGRGWLPRLVRALEGHAMVAYGRVPEQTYTETRQAPPGVINPMSGRTVTLLPRPDPCVLALDHHLTREIPTSFVWQPEDETWPPTRAWDTAGAFADTLERAGLSWGVLTEEDRQTFVHYRAQTTQMNELPRGFRWKLPLKLWRLRLLDLIDPPSVARLTG